MGFYEQNVGLVMRSLKCFLFTHWLQLYIDLSQFGKRPLLHAFIVNTICFTKDCRLTEFSLKLHIVLKLRIKALVFKRNVFFVYWFFGPPELLVSLCSRVTPVVFHSVWWAVIYLFHLWHIFYLGVLLISHLEVFNFRGQSRGARGMASVLQALAFSALFSLKKGMKKGSLSWMCYSHSAPPSFFLPTLIQLFYFL